MKVCKCDRCGRIFEPTEKSDGEFYSRVIEVGEETFGITNTEATIEITLDICDSCYNSFLSWKTMYQILEDNNGEA